MTSFRCVPASLGFLVASCAMGCASAPEERLGAEASQLESGCGEGAIQGIDVSHHNGSVSWPKVRSAGQTFAFARVSDGLTTLDRTFAANWPAMRSAGLVRGAYQFFRPRRDPVELADLTLRVIAENGGLKAGDLPPVLDIEVTDDRPAAEVVEKGLKWIARIESKIHVRPIVYTGNHMTPIIGNAFLEYPLWIAHYGVDCPRIPVGWKTWAFWQNSESGTVAGVGGRVDTNFFNYNDDLDQYRIRQTIAIDVSDLAEPRSAIPDREDEIEGGAVMGDGARLGLR